MNVTRLPVQHPNSPHCPECKRDISVFDDLIVWTSAEPTGMKVLGLTIHAVCECGAKLDLTKTVR